MGTVEVFCGNPRILLIYDYLSWQASQHTGLDSPLELEKTEPHGEICSSVQSFDSVYLLIRLGASPLP